HESLASAQDIFLGIVQPAGDLALEKECHDVGGTLAQVVKLGAHPQKKVVRTINRAAIAFADVFTLHQLRGAHNTFSEETDPLHVMIVPQTAASVLNIRFLHENRPPVFAMALVLIFQTPFQITLHLPSDAAFKKIASEP